MADVLAGHKRRGAMTPLRILRVRFQDNGSGNGWMGRNVARSGGRVSAGCEIKGGRKDGDKRLTDALCDADDGFSDED